MTCPRCGARLSGDAPECRGCGLPAIFMDPDGGPASASGDAVVEPEVLDSLEDAERTRFAAPPGMRQLGCSPGPGCGCLGLPLAVLGGVVVSSLMALLWVLSLGRVPSSLARLVRQARRGGRSRDPVG